MADMARFTAARTFQKPNEWLESTPRLVDIAQRKHVVKKAQISDDELHKMLHGD